MPIFKNSSVVGSALLVLLFVCAACFCDDEVNYRFDGSFYQSTIYEPRSEDTELAPERRLTLDATPASRVKEVFAQFVPNENKRVRRFSSSGTFIR
jgi:hypothetical protein